MSAISAAGCNIAKQPSQRRSGAITAVRRYALHVLRTWTSLAATGILDVQASIETYTIWASLSMSTVPFTVDSCTNVVWAVRSR